jgi:hypothetical protein
LAATPLLAPAAPLLDPVPPFLEPLPPFLEPLPPFLEPLPPFLDAVEVAPRLPDAPVAVTGAPRLDCAPDWPDWRLDDCPPPCLACELAACRPFDEARDALMRA